MSTSKSEQPKQTKIVSPWLVYPLALIVWWALPWAISLLTPRYGWVEGYPSIWNLIGLIAVLLGTAGLIWGVAVHSMQSPTGMEWKIDKGYMLARGMYAFSRHPMYLSELILLMGWVVFYGSIALLIAFVIGLIVFNYYAIPMEERVMETRFGDAYREYENRVRRWF